MVRVAINGFGRIGRRVFRLLLEHPGIEVVAINDIADVKTLAHLTKYDSIHGTLKKKVSSDNVHIIIDNIKIPVLNEAHPKNINWKPFNVDVIIESSGKFKKKSELVHHVNNGASKVILTVPPTDDAIKTIVLGVNDHLLKNDDIIISNASCTTNCLAPVVKVLNDTIGINKGFMTTIHSYTGDQPTLDKMHNDLYRARAAALSMIPTSTGAAKAVGLVLPELNGKLDGVAIRVPTPNVSCVDLTFESSRDTTVEEVNAAIAAAANGPLKGVLACTDLPMVSCDFNHDPASSTFHLDQTKVLDGNMVRILTWYDNEWGFSNRMLDVAAKMGTML